MAQKICCIVGHTLNAKKKNKVKNYIDYGIVMYYLCNLFPGYIGIFHLRARDVTSSVKGHHILLTTQQAITNHKDFSKMQRLLVSFDFIHYSHQIGAYWNLYPVLFEFSYFTTFFNGTFRCTGNTFSSSGRGVCRMFT